MVIPKGILSDENLSFLTIYSVKNPGRAGSTEYEPV